MPTIPIYNKCNNNCIMCINKTEKVINKKYLDLSYSFERIERFYKGEDVFIDNHRDSFSLGGGEPTLSPHLFEIIKKINNLFKGVRIICLTNGRMFAYKDYSQEFLRLNDNLEIEISIHGHNAKIHDAITRTKGSFIQSVEGLHNLLYLRKLKQTIGVRVVIHKLNYKYLEDITKFIVEELPQIDRLVYIFFEIEGRAYKNIEVLKLRYSQFFPYLKKTYKFIGHFPDVRFYHFPLCMVPFRLFPFIWRTLADSEVSFLNRCWECCLKRFCLGIPKEYLRYFGDKEFKPIKTSINIEENYDWYHPILRTK